jgi:DNA mismatch repair protein MutL
MPTFLDRGPAGEIVREAAFFLRSLPGDALEDAGDVIHDALRRLAQLMACKQAVKAGMKLKPEEIKALLEDARKAWDPRFCPHGRPTAIVLKKEELERRFDRK